MQKALGQENIDQLLKLSEDYKKSAYNFWTRLYLVLTKGKGELEIEAARSHAGDIIEERREEIIMAPAPPRAPTVIVPIASETLLWLCLS